MASFHRPISSIKVLLHILAVGHLIISDPAAAEVWRPQDLAHPDTSTPNINETQPSQQANAEPTHDCAQPPKLDEKLPSTTGERVVVSQQYRLLEGKPIHLVRLYRLPLFDAENPEENRQIHRLANQLHRNTQQTTLLKQLKISEGSILSLDTIAEAERRLRENVYISRVQITPKLDCDNHLVLWVITQDSWAITPGFNYAQIDDETTLDLSLTHVNFFGMGHTVSVGYTQKESENSTRASYYAPRLFNDNIDLSVGITRGDWIDAHNINLEKPFLTYNTNFAYGASHLSRAFERNIYLLGDSFYQYDYEFDRTSAYWGYSSGLHNNRIGRWRLGLTSTQAVFDNTVFLQPPQGEQGILTPINNRDRRLAWIQYSSFSNQFKRLTNIRNIKRVEDIPLSPIWRLQLGYIFNNSDKDAGTGTDVNQEDARNSDLIQIETGLRVTPIFSKHHLLQSAINITANWKTEADEIENGFVTADLTYFWLLGDNHRFVVELAGTHGHKLTLDRLLTQGGANGLRGYPSIYQLGNNQYRATTEYRYYFQPELLNIFQFAVALYMDSGRAWFTENLIGIERYAGDENLWNMGVGLRIASNRVGFGSIAHIDVATPMTDPPPTSVFGTVEPYDNLRFTIVLKSAF